MNQIQIDNRFYRIIAIDTPCAGKFPFNTEYQVQSRTRTSEWETLRKFEYVDYAVEYLNSIRLVGGMKRTRIIEIKE